VSNTRKSSRLCSVSTFPTTNNRLEKWHSVDTIWLLLLTERLKKMFIGSINLQTKLTGLLTVKISSLVRRLLSITASNWSSTMECPWQWPQRRLSWLSWKPFFQSIKYHANQRSHFGLVKLLILNYLSFQVSNLISLLQKKVRLRPLRCLHTHTSRVKVTAQRGYCWPHGSSQASVVNQVKNTGCLVLNSCRIITPFTISRRKRLV